jgi:hypothetical protein
MIALACVIWSASAAPFKSKNRFEAESAALRHQLVVLQRKVRGRSGSPTAIGCSSFCCIVLGSIHHHYCRI